MSVQGALGSQRCQYSALEELRVDVRVGPPQEFSDAACGLPRSVSGVRPRLSEDGPADGLASDCLGDHADRERQAELDLACAISCLSPTELAISDRRARCPGVLHFDLCAGRDGGVCAKDGESELPPHPACWTCRP